MTRVEVGPNDPDSGRIGPGIALPLATVQKNFMRSHDSDDLTKRNIRWVEIQTGTATDYLRLPTPPLRMTTLSFNPEMPNKSYSARALVFIKPESVLGRLLTGHADAQNVLHCNRFQWPASLVFLRPRCSK